MHELSKQCRSGLVLTLVFFAVLEPIRLSASALNLPMLGDTSSGIVSQQQEYLIGRSWLKAFRSRIQEFDDPVLQEYTEQLLYNLATYSDLEDPRLELVLVDNPTMNAFAVPGGVIGIHTGIFNYAKTEDQLASVLAHELAHLSQRHFARGIEEQRKSSTLTMGGLLAGLVIAATVGGDAGTAALSVTQAAAMDGRLRYTRNNEQEADRIGLQTLRGAGRNPSAAAEMFEIMLVATRHSGSRPPEFLLTHPVTERRIADTRSRTISAPLRHYPHKRKYQLMRARALVGLTQNPKSSIRHFEHLLSKDEHNNEAERYGLVLALIADNRLKVARTQLNKLIQSNPQELVFRHTDIELDIQQQKLEDASTKIDDLLTANPNNYPLTLLRSEVSWQAKHYQKASETLKLLSRQRPNDPNIWYRLAEVRGLAGDISGVHLARAEYFVLVGAFRLARKHLALAASLVSTDFKQSAIIRQRLRELVAVEEQVVKL